METTPCGENLLLSGIGESKRGTLRGKITSRMGGLQHQCRAAKVRGV